MMDDYGRGPAMNCLPEYLRIMRQEMERKLHTLRTTLAIGEEEMQLEDMKGQVDDQPNMP
jgi:hypothetical protein